MSVKLNLNYNVSAHRVLHDRKMRDMLPIMRDTGVETLWLFGYFYGRFESTLAEIEAANKYLVSEGFTVNRAISLPVGHPGNALDGDISSHTDLTIPDTWHYRVDGEGRNTYFCAAIDDVMIKDNAEAARQLRDIGMTKIFYDDDLRTSSTSRIIGGCFCEKCLKSFAEEFGTYYDRQTLYTLLRSESNEELTEAWTAHNCNAVVKLLKAVTHEGLTSGIMVAQGGKRRNGIDIPLIKKELPGTFFRVGEGNFRDEDFEREEGKSGLIRSLLTHKELIGDVSKTYSETTVFPARALSPENMVEKMRIEVKNGIKNIYLMSGVWLIDEPYWAAIKKAMPELIALSEQN